MRLRERIRGWCARQQRKILETTAGVRMELLAWGNTAMEPHLFRVKPNGGSGESYAHEGEEFLHILRGEFEIWLGDKEHYRLKTGDSLYFESSTPHRWRNPGPNGDVAAVDQYAADLLEQSSWGRTACLTISFLGYS